jgi:predicted Zn-dependent peptidase
MRKPVTPETGAYRMKTGLTFLGMMIMSLVSPKILAYDTLPAGVSIYTLDNGLQILMIEKPSLPMVGVNVVVKVGSAYEDFASSGMSHMLEHLLFNGTSEMSQKELYDATDLIGGYNNANTGEYYTNYMMVTPREFSDSGMKIQAAMLFDSTLPEAKFEKEKGIVMEEIAKSLARPDEQADRHIRSFLYQGHALSLPVLGTYETIRHMNRDQVYSFYKNHYVPNNMILSVIGNFKTQEMLAQIKSIYGTRAPGKVAVEDDGHWKTGFQKANLPGSFLGRTFHRFFSGKTMTLKMFFELPGSLSSEALSLLDVFFEKETEALQQLLQTENPDSFQSISLAGRPSPISQVLLVNLTLKDDRDIEKIQKTIRRELTAMTFAMASQTIENQAVLMQSAFFRNTEKPHMFGIYNAENFAVGGIESILSAYSGKGYQKAADVLKDLSFSKYMFSLLLHPKVKGEKSDTVQDASVVQLPEFKGGASLIVKQIPGSELIALHYLIKHKAYYQNLYGKDAAELFHDCFGQRMASPEIQEKIKMYGLKFTVNDNPWIPMDDIYTHPDFGYVRVEGLSRHATEIIGFLNDAILHFVPTPEEFGKAQSKLKRMAMMHCENPAAETFEKEYKTRIYVQQPEQEEVEDSYENLLQFGKAYFQPGNMILSIVSHLDAGTLGAEFASFSSEVPDIADIPAPLSKELKIPENGEELKIDLDVEQAKIFYGYVKSVDEKDRAALRALSLLLRDEIIFNIREKQGLAYRMGAGISVLGDKALFYINMGTRPENVKTLEPQFAELFSRETISLWTEKDLNKAVSMYLGRMMFRRLSSINQGFYLGNSLYLHDDISWDQNQLELLKQVTFEDVTRVAELYLGVENPISIIVY